MSAAGRPADAGDEQVRALLAAVEDLRASVAGLTERLDRIEGRLAGVEDATGVDDVPQEVVIAISAAVAAYLGKRATVKQVRLRRGSSWGAAGRTAIQQSHSISHRAGRGQP